ncbi:unnamed protein product [Blumeria hordei]|uniref:Arrestin C-terminal-like domain-containing protein n=1 Tax=Blumeria hordei TaxID=2867405 RepID=A0A383USH4_BLUHO|nr:unnamed protein product [Blumeria hordei]
MPKFFSALTGKNSSATLFEIRLAKDVIVLHGDSIEASSQILSGVVVLRLHQALKVEDLHLKMSGLLKISWPEKKNNNDTEGNLHVYKNCEIFNHKWAPFIGGVGPGSSSKGLILHPGNYEWPFDLILPGSMAESIEGMRETYITYKLKATLARGKLAHDLHTWKPVRIIRTLDSTDLDLAQPMSVENVWPNKVEYSVMVPQKAVMFGTAVDIEMRFTMLLKGLRIGEIKCRLFEIIELTAMGSALRHESEKTYSNEKQIGMWIFHMSENSYQEMLFDNGQDGHLLIEKLPLPKKLNECLQDCDTNGIKVRHKVKFNVVLINPDGHHSELHATIPISIFFSPSMPLTASGELINQSSESNASAIDIMRHAPPLYGDHLMDPLFSGAYQPGLMTPGFRSGMNTPARIHSRTGSSENLASLDGTLSPCSPAVGAITPAALSSRLQNLSFGSRNSSFRRLAGLGSSGSSTPHIYPNVDSDRHGSFDGSYRLEFPRNLGYTASNPLSRRASGDTGSHSNPNSGQHTPDYSETLDMEGLSKVPSYSTVRRMTYDSLPNYESVLSRPPSPARTLSFAVPSRTNPSASSSRPATTINNNVIIMDNSVSCNLRDNSKNAANMPQ